MNITMDLIGTKLMKKQIDEDKELTEEEKELLEKWHRGDCGE